MTFPFLNVRWDGKSLKPVNPFWLRIAEKSLVAGETYRIREDPLRSTASHRHYFAAIREGWSQLPECYACYAGKDGPELLRKHCLIEAGYKIETRVVFNSAQDAQRAAFMVEERARPECYTLAYVKGCVVHKWVAESQSENAMGAKRFYQSKRDVLEIIANIIGVSVDQLTRNAGLEAQERGAA